MRNKKIKVKGKCPLCKNKVDWGSWQYFGEPDSRTYLPVCTNINCEFYNGYDSRIKYRYINHKTVKIEGVYD